MSYVYAVSDCKIFNSYKLSRVDVRFFIVTSLSSPQTRGMIKDHIHKFKAVQPNRTHVVRIHYGMSFIDSINVAADNKHRMVNTIPATY